MNTHNLHLVTAIGPFVIILALIAGYYYFQSRRSASASWEELLAKLTRIDRNKIAEVALDLVDESGQPKAADDAGSLDPLQVWKLTGGLEGLEVLERNSEVLIDLAFYVQQWYPEALVIAERLRLDAGELKWHVERLKGAAQKGNLQISFPFYAQRAVVSYYRMTRRVLRLYEAGNFSMLPDLQKAL
ncbi:MAG: hypothetical protein WCD57_08430 [Acidobacteriaceae bacterium]